MYSYETEKHNLFTENGLKLYTGIRDNVLTILKLSGAITMDKAIQLPPGLGGASNWEMMACIDHMVINNELIEIPTNGAGQDRIFIKARS